LKPASYVEDACALDEAPDELIALARLGVELAEHLRRTREHYADKLPGEHLASPQADAWIRMYEAIEKTLEAR